MTGYTSGKTHRDPLPYVDQWGIDRNDDGDPSGYDFNARFHYAPRPEYDNHNPILEAMRQELDCYASAADAAADWLHSIERGDHDETISDDKLDHARRVLTKLAALTTTPNGVTD